MPALSLDRFSELLCTIRSTIAAPHQRLAAEVQLHHAALDSLPPETVARLIQQAAAGHAQATHHLRLTVCPPPAPPPPRPTPVRPWPLPEPPTPLLQPDPPTAVRRRYAHWQQIGLVPADMTPATLAAAYTRLHGRPPFKIPTVGFCAYGLYELGRTVMAMKRLRAQQSSQE